MTENSDEARLNLRCSRVVHDAFVDFAEDHALTHRDLFERMVRTVTGLKTDAVSNRSKPQSGKVDVRLRAEEKGAALKLAEADGRTLPGWIRAVLRRVIFKAPAFNSHELDLLQSLSVDLRKMGTNLNQLIHYMHRTGRPEPALSGVDAIRELIERLRREQLALLDRSSNRYEYEADE